MILAYILTLVVISWYICGTTIQGFNWCNVVNREI